MAEPTQPPAQNKTPQAKPAIVQPSAPTATAAPIPAPAQQAAPQIAVVPQAKPAVPQKKKTIKLDWLFTVACLVAVIQTILLVFLNNEKNEYNTIKKEDADRVYVLQKASSVTQADINQLESAFLGEKEVISFIQTLEASRGMFDEFELAFTSDEAQGKDVHFLPFSITAIGGRDTVTSFVAKLLGSTYALEATEVEFTQNEDDSNKLNLSFTGNLYIQNGK